MTRSIFHRSSIAAATALATVLTLGALGDAGAAGYKQEGVQQHSQQLQNRADSAQNQQHVREVQQKLNQKGHNVGSVDGQFGPKTSSALRQFQQAEGIQPSGQIDSQTLQKLGIASAGSGSTGSLSTSGASSGSMGSYRSPMDHSARRADGRLLDYVPNAEDEWRNS